MIVQRINSNQNHAGTFACVERFVQGDTMNKIHIQRLEIMSGIYWFPSIKSDKLRSIGFQH